MGLKDWEERNLIVDVKEVKEFMHDQPRPAPRKYVERQVLSNAELISILSTYPGDNFIMFSSEDYPDYISINTVEEHNGRITLSCGYNYE